MNWSDIELPGCPANLEEKNIAWKEKNAKYLDYFKIQCNIR